jgi:hypothetical protein
MRRRKRGAFQRRPCPTVRKSSLVAKQVYAKFLFGFDRALSPLVPPNFVPLTKALLIPRSFRIVLDGLEHMMNIVLTMFDQEEAMFRAIMEEAAALASILLFVGMIAVWAQILSMP